MLFDIRFPESNKIRDKVSIVLSESKERNDFPHRSSHENHWQLFWKTFFQFFHLTFRFQSAIAINTIRSTIYEFLRIMKIESK